MPTIEFCPPDPGHVCVGEGIEVVHAGETFAVEEDDPNLPGLLASPQFRLVSDKRKSDDPSHGASAQDHAQPTGTAEQNIDPKKG